jgi:hypothetical protein
MVVSIGFKDTEEGKLDRELPFYLFHIPLTYDLFFREVPILAEVFYKRDELGSYQRDASHEVGHDDSRLHQVKEGLTEFLYSYTPAPEDRRTMEYMLPPDLRGVGQFTEMGVALEAEASETPGAITGGRLMTTNVEETVKLAQSLEGVTGMKQVGGRVKTIQEVIDQDHRFLQYAAFRLNQVVDYAMQNPRNIQVN